MINLFASLEGRGVWFEKKRGTSWSRLGGEEFGEFIFLCNARVLNSWDLLFGLLAKVDDQVSRVIGLRVDLDFQHNANNTNIDRYFAYGFEKLLYRNSYKKNDSCTLIYGTYISIYYKIYFFLSKSVWIALCSFFRDPYYTYS
jgi:hypothetical protein